MKATVVRQTALSQVPLLAISLIINLFIFFQWRKARPALSSLAPWDILGSAFCFCLFVYSVSAFFLRRKGEIIIDDKGVRVKGYGLIYWTSIDSFGMVNEPDSEGGVRPYLIIRLKNSREVKCPTFSLDKTGPQIVMIMRKYSEGHDLTFQKKERIE